MHNHIGCICVTFLHCALSNVSSNGLLARMQSHIGHIYSTFIPLCVFKCVLKLPVINDAKSHWLHFFYFFHCEFSNVSSNGLPEKMHSHIGCIYLISGPLHLHPSNQSHNFQDFAPLPMFVMFCPNGCFKLSQIYHWLLVSNNYNCFVFHGILSLSHNCLGGSMWQIS